MRNWNPISIIAAWLLIIVVLAGCSTTEAAGTHRYKERIDQFEQEDTELYDVVFVGNSLTEAGDWDEYFADVRIANRGIWGDTTRGVLQRMNSISATQAEKAFILLGVNDLFLGASPQEVAGRYMRIVNSLVADRMDVYIQSTLPVFSSKRVQKLIDQLNVYLWEMTKKMDQVHYIDVASSMSRNEYIFDGIHLNKKGYRVWRDVLSEYIR